MESLKFLYSERENFFMFQYENIVIMDSDYKNSKKSMTDHSFWTYILQSVTLTFLSHRLIRSGFAEVQKESNFFLIDYLLCG